MYTPETKKLALIRILQILKENSDYDHPMTQDDIAGILARDYGIDIERKAVGRNIVLKVIIESCLLNNDEIVRACLAAKAAGADFVKTSTGFSTGGATVEAVKLMRETVGPEMGVKASGGVRTHEDLIAMVEAGANRIGTSSGAKII